MLCDTTKLLLCKQFNAKFTQLLRNKHLTKTSWIIPAAIHFSGLEKKVFIHCESRLFLGELGL